MPLTAASLSASLGWTLSKPQTGSQATKQGPDAVGFGPTVDLTKVTQVLRLRLVLAGAATQTVDLSTFTNLVGETPAILKAYGLIMAPVGSTLAIAQGGTNGLVWLAETVPDGGVLCFYQPSPGKTVDATHKTLLFTAGPAAVTADVAILLGDV